MPSISIFNDKRHNRIINWFTRMVVNYNNVTIFKWPG